MAEAAAGAVQTVASPITKGFESIGVSSPVSNILGGATVGGVFGLPGRVVGGVLGREAEKAQREQRKAAEAAEIQRQEENEAIFSLAERLSGEVANNPNFNFEQLRFRGNDPRSQRLQELVASLQGRAATIQAQEITPGGSQTRLSLV